MTEGIITIKKGREKPISNQHPWIFSGAIAKAENAVDGELVTIFDHNNNFIARGYWNSQSQIQVRILTWKNEPITDEWWENKFEQAVKLRSVLRVYSEDYQEQVACRIVNAENDFLPGLVIDQYADWYVLQALTLYIDKNKKKLAEIFATVVGTDQIYERSDVDVRQREGLQESVGLLIGSNEPPEFVEIIENSKTFNVNIRAGHKTGFYLDQYENRGEIERLVNFYVDTANDVDEIQLLNLFSYTGGFAMSAHSIGVPLHSVNVDASYEALEIAEANYQLNNFNENEEQSAEFIQADCFDYLHHCVDEGKVFDIVVLDPPKFAHNKRQIDKASRGYKDLNLNAFKIIRSGGYLMTFSCSGAISRDLFQKIVFGALADSGRQAQIIHHLSAGDDHPVALTFPEGEYLKGLLLRVF